MKWSTFVKIGFVMQIVYLYCTQTCRRCFQNRLNQFTVSKSANATLRSMRSSTIADNEKIVSHCFPNLHLLKQHVGAKTVALAQTPPFFKIIYLSPKQFSFQTRDVTLGYESAWDICEILSIFWRNRLRFIIRKCAYLVFKFHSPICLVGFTLAGSEFNLNQNHTFVLPIVLSTLLSSNGGEELLLKFEKLKSLSKK